MNELAIKYARGMSKTLTAQPVPFPNRPLGIWEKGTWSHEPGSKLQESHPHYGPFQVNHESSRHCSRGWVKVETDKRWGVFTRDRECGRSGDLKASGEWCKSTLLPPGPENPVVGEDSTLGASRGSPMVIHILWSRPIPTPNTGPTGSLISLDSAA